MEPENKTTEQTEHERCYQALLAHDPRFDGVFFVGVSTTGIYCRTVCPAKTPGRDRCTFYPSAAAAERAGFRPCLRCRPELAPGNAKIDAVSRLAAAAASRIEDGALTTGSVADLSADLGVSDRHLRRAILAEFGVSPIALAQTQRLLLAKRLLTDTSLTITDVAFASGFSSLRRFNALFKERYRLSPGLMRKSRHAGAGKETLHCELAFRPPLDWDSLVGFLAQRASRGVEAVEGRRYLRTLSFGKHAGWIVAEPSPKANTICVEVSTSLAPALSAVLGRMKRLFDLTAEPLHIAERLGPIALAHPGLRVPGAADGFALAVRAILGQQISVKAASTLSCRFVAAFGEEIETPYEQLTHKEPTAQRVAAAAASELVSLGILPARAQSILALARDVAEDPLSLEPGADVDRAMAQLKSLPGVGEWTAQYIAMRALSWPDAFPHADLGIQKALGERDAKCVLALSQAWRPWRAYAAMHLWKSLETHRQ